MRSPYFHSSSSIMSQDNTSSRPGEQALKNMKLLKNESSVFKVPKVPQQPTSKKKSHVLDEDLYVEGISKIIQRDFFPDLEKLKAQNEFLEATENKDYAKLQEITRKYSGNRPHTEPYNSPATFDTPDVTRPQSPVAATVREQRAASVESNVTNKPKDLTDNHSLDSFLATHTSEDNASYDRVIALEDKKRYTKLASQFEAETNSAMLCDAALALPSIEQQADQTNRPDELDTWRFKARNFIMYVPDGSGQPPPVKPELQHQNTRLKVEPFDHSRYKQTISELAKNQEAVVSGKIGVDGASAAPAAADSGAYSLVATPSPRPGAGPDQSPLMTWGRIEGTPFRLDGGDTPLPSVGAGAAYRMLECGARERIALQLAEQAAKRRRPTTPLTRVHTPSFRTNTERLASMSPAARKLAAKHLLTPKLKLTPNMGVFDPATPKRTATPLRRLVTPQGRLVTPQGRLVTPQGRLVTPNSKRPKLPKPSSEGSVEDNSNVAESVGNNNITDNLLQINVAKRTRVTAADFFS